MHCVARQATIQPCLRAHTATIQARGAQQARRQLDEWALGCTTCAGSRRRWACGRAERARSRRADTAWTLGGVRHAQTGARGVAGLASCAHKLGQVGCFGAPDSVFGLVRLSIVRESLNEYCSLQKK